MNDEDRATFLPKRRGAIRLGAGHHINTSRGQGEAAMGTASCERAAKSNSRGQRKVTNPPVERLEERRLLASVLLTSAQVAQAAYNAGFRTSSLVYAVAIAGAESSFYRDAVNVNSPSSIDYGLWQINTFYHPQYDAQKLLDDADYNAQAAYAISSNGTSWQPWATYYAAQHYNDVNYEGQGAYRNWLSTAITAGSIVHSTVVHAIGDSVHATTNGLTVRNTAGGTAQSQKRASGDTGTILDGFSTAQIGGTGKTWIWWKVHWSDGQEGWSAQDFLARTATATGGLNVTTLSANGQSAPFADVKLYDSSFSFLADKPGNGTGTASFTNLTAGSYHLEEYAANGDFWGGAAVTVTANQTTPVTLRQAEPYETSIRVFNNTTNAEVTGGMVQPGTPLRMEVVVRNDTTADKAVQVLSDFGLNAVGYSDIGNATVTANSTKTFSFTHTPTTAGVYSEQVTINTYINNHYSPTDTVPVTPVVTLASTNLRPSVSGITTPSGTQQGAVTIPYTLTDAESDACNVQVEYSSDSGAHWLNASRSNGAGDGLSGLSASPSGTNHTFVWDTYADIGTTNNSNLVIRISPSDAGGTGSTGTTNPFTVHNNYPPTFLSLNPSSVFENMPVGTYVGTLFTTDGDVIDTWTYSLVSGTGSDDNGSFTLVGSDIRTNAVFDFEAKNSYSIRVRTVDSANQSYEQQISITITDVAENPSGLTFQPGPANGQDTWVTSVFYGGGLDNDELRVGGWGDSYYSLLKFDVSGLPTNATSATLYLYDKPNDPGASATAITLWQVTSTWNESTKWSGQPSATQIASLPAPTGGNWFAINLTSLYNAWRVGTSSNYGIELRPVNSDNNWDIFYSSDYMSNPSLRPKLVITSSQSLASVGGKTDIGDGAMVVRGDGIGSANGGAYTGVTGLIQSGRNGGSWNGNGIVTSVPVGNLKTVGVATAANLFGSAAGTFAGETVSGSNVLVKYTYGGDANLDGKINVDDYGRIDSSIPLGIAGWYNGDFNYDGKINVDDYGIIDSNIGIQGAPLGSSASGTAASAASPAFSSAAAAALPPGRRGLTPLGTDKLTDSIFPATDDPLI